jgi:glycosyltransferase involved in cell wall biosynthesis
MVELSVIMPVYNQELYVARAIESVLQQTYGDFEFIIVDDGSSDRTIEIIESFDDSRIRLIRAPHKGFIDALALATAEAKGKWLARMDSDDVCAPNRFEKQIQFLADHPECVFVTSYYGIVTLHDKYLTPARSPGWNYVKPRDISLATKPFCDPGTMYDRKLALEIGYDSDLKWEKTLWYGLLAKGNGAVLEEPLYFTRWRIGSVSRDYNPDLEELNYNINLKYDPANAHKPRYPGTNGKVNMRNEMRSVYYYSTAGDFVAARTTALGTWRRYPFNLDAIKLVLLSVGIRRRSRIDGPAGMDLFPTSSPFAKT